MKRRTFLTTSAALGLTPFAAASAMAQPAAGRTIYELRKYTFATEQQFQGFQAFAADAAVPALNRAGVEPVGVFLPMEETTHAFALFPHKSFESMATLVQRLGDDEAFMSRGEAFLRAQASDPAYQRVESSLMIGFKGMPHIEKPVTNDGRIFELRIYESPSVLTGQKKIEMFNDAGEIAIFRRVGLHPVFFGETVIGPLMPNLTYMLGFESMEQRKENWSKFGRDPEWQKLRSMDEYADKNILSNITREFLRPAACSQI